MLVSKVGWMWARRQAAKRRCSTIFASADEVRQAGRARSRSAKTASGAVEVAEVDWADQPPGGQVLQVLGHQGCRGRCAGRGRCWWSGVCSSRAWRPSRGRAGKARRKGPDRRVTAVRRGRARPGRVVGRTARADGPPAAAVVGRLAGRRRLVQRARSLRTASAPCRTQRAPVISSRSPIRCRQVPSITPVAIGQPACRTVW